MTVPILCLVCLCLLGWVVFLKLEIKELTDADTRTTKAGSKNVAAKNMEVTKGRRSFTIG